MQFKCASEVKSETDDHNVDLQWRINIKLITQIQGKNVRNVDVILMPPFNLL